MLYLEVRVYHHNLTCQGAYTKTKPDTTRTIPHCYFRYLKTGGRGYTKQETAIVEKQQLKKLNIHLVQTEIQSHWLGFYSGRSVSFCIAVIRFSFSNMYWWFVPGTWKFSPLPERSERSGGPFPRSPDLRASWPCAVCVPVPRGKKMQVQWAKEGKMGFLWNFCKKKYKKKEKKKEN